jgi:hypothetical protein
LPAMKPIVHIDIQTYATFMHLWSSLIPEFGVTGNDSIVASSCSELGGSSRLHDGIWTGSAS